MTSAFRPLLDALRPGLRVFVQGAVGEPQGLIAALAAEPDRARGVSFTVCMIPGVNTFDYAALHPKARLEVFMPSRAVSATLKDGRTRVRPLSYCATADYLSRAHFDLAVVQVSPPGPGGFCSLGVSGDFSPLVWTHAGRRIGIVNADLPAPPRSEVVEFRSLDACVEDATAMLEGPEPAPSEILARISRRVADLVPDGAAIQTGIGAAPSAVLLALAGRRNLRIRSGLLIPAHRRLHEAGALAPRDLHVAGVAYGPREFYAWAAANDLAAFASVRRTHSPSALAEVEGFHAINSALEVDLFGQANLEWLGPEAVSGVGGGPDFARAALASPGGRSILALPSRAGGRPRIVPRLEGPTVSLARSETDLIVTEWGTAALRDLDVAARASALIGLADPEDRPGLDAAWRRMNA